MIYLAPSILSANILNLKEDIKQMEQSGVKYLHIDVMDGHFVPNISFGPSIIKNIKNHTSMILDVHLMIENPDKYIEQFVVAGADQITVHAEACIHLHRTLQTIKSFGKKAYVALNPATDISCLKYILDLVDGVLVMTVNPGFGGQKFIFSMIDKIKEVKRLTNEYKKNIFIEVDGGINSQNIKQVVEAGIDIAVIGSAIYQGKDINQAIVKLEQAMYN